MQHPSTYNEAELLKQVAGGSEAAFTTLFRAYQAKLYTHVYKITDSREMAEDVVHEVFLKIWKYRERLGGVENFNAYLHRAATNHVYTSFRRMAKETLILAELQREAGTAIAEPVPGLMAKEVKAFIEQALLQLTPQQRLVFRLSREEGLKQEEIARRLGIGLSTVKTHMVDALRTLREEIGRSYGAQAIAICVIYNIVAQS